MNFVKLYIGDYLRDTGTLSVAEHGAYMLMLMHHYATEKPLPEGRELHRLVRAETKVERDAVDAVLARFWTRSEAGWVNARAAEEFERAGQISETNRGIAVRREETKRARREHDESPLRAQSVHDESTYQTPDTRHQTNPPTPRKRGRVSVHEFPPGFDAFWAAYPRKVARDAAAKAFAKLRPDDALQATMLASLRRQAAADEWTKDGGRFVPHAATWLNGRRWEDIAEGGAGAADPFAGAL